MSDLVPMHDGLHRQTIEDCPVATKNLQDGWRPFLRVEFLAKDGETSVMLHVCGEKNPLELTAAMRALAEELDKLLLEISKEPGEGDGADDEAGGPEIT